MEGIYPLTVTLTKKEAIMRKVKLIVHETYQGKRKTEDVFAAVFLSSGTAYQRKITSTTDLAELLAKPSIPRLEFLSKIPIHIRTSAKIIPQPRLADLPTPSEPMITNTT